MAFFTQYTKKGSEKYQFGVAVYQWISFIGLPWWDAESEDNEPGKDYLILESDGPENTSTSLIQVRYNPQSGVQLIRIIIPVGTQKMVGVTFDGKFIWIIRVADGGGFFLEKIDYLGSVQFSVALTAATEPADLRGLTFDGKHLYYLESPGGGIFASIVQIDTQANVLRSDTLLQQDVNDLTHDGKYIWIIGTEVETGFPTVAQYYRKKGSISEVFSFLPVGSADAGKPGITTQGKDLIINYP